MGKGIVSPFEPSRFGLQKLLALYYNLLTDCCAKQFLHQSIDYDTQEEAGFEELDDTNDVDDLLSD